MSLVTTPLYALTFEQAVDLLGSHESVEQIRSRSKSIDQSSGLLSSWGDPVLKISAKNFPTKSFNSDKTPMTGIEIGISQKVPLTHKYGKIENSVKSTSAQVSLTADKQRQRLIKNLWEILINRRMTSEQKLILQENIHWLVKIIKVSNKLYANGKISQQALLEIQIRKAELEGLLSNIKYDFEKTQDQIEYLVSTADNQLATSTIPWHLLEQTSETQTDYTDLALEKKIQSKRFAVSAAKLNSIPDLTIGIGYTKRSNIDQQGDFLGASISLPLPVSQRTGSKRRKTIHEKNEAVLERKNYLKNRVKNIKILKKDIKKVQAELTILTRKTVVFAKNSRSIISKSYSLGNSSYLELLQSELTLQNIMLKKSTLTALKYRKKVQLKFILGDSLHD